MRSMLCLAVALLVLTGAADPVKEEVWEGKLAINAGIKVRLVLKIVKADDGTLSATLDSPDQGTKGLKVDSIALEGQVLKFAMKAIAGEFSGTLNESRTEAVGEWKQGGLALPLTLGKVDRPSELRRPQTPKPPYAYDVDEVTYQNKSAGVTLAGTLTTPRGPGKFPAAILISGSGAQDRDETILGHKPFLVLADDLTRRGVAVLRVDDRGVGGSSGRGTTPTSEDFAGDVLAGIEFLRSSPRIDARRIGLIGHSEGGIIGPMVANRSEHVAFLVLMAGTGLPGDEIIAQQSALIFAAMESKKDLAQGLDFQRRLFEVVKSEPDNKVAADRMRAILREQVAAMPEADRNRLGDANRQIESQIAVLQAPWCRFFLTYDPRPALARVRCPVLAIIGEKDLQVPPRENLAAIEKALKAAGNAHARVEMLPGLNHLFQTSHTGAPAEYAAIEETIAPSALSMIADWVCRQVEATP
jgi:uncharacterized protein